jgi:hypothetical protein
MSFVPKISNYNNRLVAKEKAKEVNEHRRQAQAFLRHRPTIRRFYGRGSIVRVLEGNFLNQKIRLEIDIQPHMKGITRFP